MKFPAVLCLLLLHCFWAFTQQAGWRINPYEDRYFIENIGQWGPAMRDISEENPVIAGVENLGTEIYFHMNGFEYRHRRSVSVPSYLVASAETQEPENEVEDHMRLAWDTLSIRAHWVGIYRSKFELESPQSPLFHYAHPAGQIFGARSFARLRHPNLYPGVELVYEFHAIEGIKYALTVHPGADASQIALEFEGMEQAFLDADGNFHAQLRGAELIDHAPTAYLQESGLAVPIRFQLTGNRLAFEIGAYDTTQTLVIDPWLINPGFTAQGKVFDVSWDCSGNVYAFGGSGPWKVKKFNSAGTLVWNYNTSHTAWYGDLVSDDLGNVYIVEGCCNGNREKLNSAGAVQWSVNNGVYEFWRLAYSCDWSKLVLANAYSGGGVAPTQSLSTVNTATGALTGGVTVSASEPRSVIGSPSGNFYAITAVGNELLARTNVYGAVYNVPNGYSLLYNGPLYSNGTNTTQGQNAIALNSNFIYTSNGATLMKRNLGTGALITSVALPAGVAEQNSGVAVDNCGNVFVGGSSSLYQYDANLNLVATTAMGGAVYDVTVSGLSAVLVAGNGMLSSQVAPCPAVCPTCVILPSGLEAFEAQANADGGVDVHWAVQNAGDDIAYAVERSADGLNFTRLHTQSAGKSNYDYLDRLPLTGYRWYRLAIENQAGETHYSPVRQVFVDRSQSVLSIFPNPAQDWIQVQIPFNPGKAQTLQVMDAQGRMVMQRVLPEDAAVISLEIEDLAAGIYVLRLSGGAVGRFCKGE